MPRKKRRSGGNKHEKASEQARSRSASEGNTDTQLGAQGILPVVQTIAPIDGATSPVNQGRCPEQILRRMRSSSEGDTDSQYEHVGQDGVTTLQASVLADETSLVTKGITNVSINSIQAEKVNIQFGNSNVMNINKSTSDADESLQNSSDEEPSGGARTDDDTEKLKQRRIFLEKVNNFKEGHFVLLVGKQDTLLGIDTLAFIKWTAVFDFDSDSEYSGLYSRLHDIMSKLRSLHVDNIQTEINNDITGLTTNWLFVRGTTGKPHTVLAQNFSEWRKEVKTHFDRTLPLLDKFQQFNKLTFVVIWPDNDNDVKCMHFVIQKILETIADTHIIIVDVQGSSKSDISQINLQQLTSENCVTVIKFRFKDFLYACMTVTEPVRTDERKYRLPTKDGIKACGISDDKYHWLNEMLEVLYGENESINAFNKEWMEKELAQFYKGGTLSWEWWYAVKQGHAEIERDICRELCDYIKDVFIHKKRSGVVTLLHAPGGGGTTLAQRVMWDLRTTTPCVVVKRHSEKREFDLIERLTFLIDKTHLPLVVLVDGEYKHKVKSLLAFAVQCDITVVVFHVRRKHFADKDYHTAVHGTFTLTGILSMNEALVLQSKLSSYCRSNQRKRRNIQKLIDDVMNGIDRTIFEFGLAAHSYEYAGIEAYVDAHLRLHENEDGKLRGWQLALAYLALVNYYGHSSLPCHFFTSLLSHGSGNSFFDIHDFPGEMRELIVPVTNEVTQDSIRISHFYVAKQILDRLLPMLNRCKAHDFNLNALPSFEVSAFLSKRATESLGTFSQMFIRYAKQETGSELNDVILRILVNTFIHRENKDLLEEDETTPLRKHSGKKCAPILEDASDASPYTDRFDIYNCLVDCFPEDPQFRAHLGRLYVICRSHEEDNAEYHLEKAYGMIKSQIERCQSDYKVYHYDRFRIRNICHMFGTMLSRKVYKYTGQYRRDHPAITLSKDDYACQSKQLVKTVHKACDLFKLCREMTSTGHQNVVGYIDEIRLRLMFCKFVRSYNDFQDIAEYYAKATGIEVKSFVESSSTVLDCLFDEMDDIIESPNKREKDTMEELREIYEELFTPKSDHLMQKKDTPTQRRSEIAMLKLKYESRRKTKGYLENLTDPGEITMIVDNCEENFQVESPDQGLDGDYREWIQAIRHPAFPKDYPLDKVYDHVNAWYKHVTSLNNGEKQTVARFYIFVFASVLGFGTVEKPGDQNLLKRSHMLKRELRQHIKCSRSVKCRRELLGPPVETVRRLVQRNVKYHDRDSHSLNEDEIKKLEIRKGWISEENKHPSHGYIELDLGPTNETTVRVFYEPKKWDLIGSCYSRQRVEFVLEFNMRRGYEAHNVKLLKQTNCSNKCGNKILYRSCDTCVECPRCNQRTEIVQDD